MDYQFLKQLSQWVIFIGTFIAFLGSVSLWYFNDKLENERKKDSIAKEIALDERTKERDAAIKSIKQSTLLTAELDTPIRYVLFRVFLKGNYSISELKGFRLFVEFSNFNAYYDLSISHYVLGNETFGFCFVNKAGKPDNFHSRPYQMSECGPTQPLQYFSWNLLQVLHEKPNLRLKDLHMGSIKVSAHNHYLDRISNFDILCNCWRIAHLPANDHKPVWVHDPLVDVTNKGDYSIYQFDNHLGMTQDFRFINLFDGTPEKMR